MDIEETINTVLKELSEKLAFEEPDEDRYNNKNITLQIQKIASGASGIIYFITNTNNNITFVAKVGSCDSLDKEKKIYEHLENNYNPYFPRYYGYYKIGKICILYIQKADGTVSELLDTMDGKCRESIINQCYLILDLLNKVDVVHCDVKLENFLYIEIPLNLI